MEVGWRLAAEYWGRGYATEGARAALTFGFERRHLNEIVAFTAAINVRSIRVMEGLGMSRNPADDFDHTSIPGGHPLRCHVLYRLSRESFETAISRRHVFRATDRRDDVDSSALREI